MKKNDLFNFGETLSVLTDDITGYFFWTFFKDKAGYFTGDSYASSLLTAIESNTLRYNASQPFPVQVYHPKSETEINESRHTCLNIAKAQAQNQRKNLMSFILNNEIKYYEHLVEREKTLLGRFT